MRMNLRIVGMVALAVFFLGGLAIASEPREATVFNVRGDAFVRQSSGDWKPAEVGMILRKSDEIKTSNKGVVELLLDEGKVGSVQIHPKTQVKLDRLDNGQATGEKHTLLGLAVGKVLVHAEKLQGSSTFEVRTPTSTTGVRGTMFEVSYE